LTVVNDCWILLSNWGFVTVGKACASFSELMVLTMLENSRGLGVWSFTETRRLMATLVKERMGLRLWWEICRVC
jgi:hypothetical protein